MAYASQGKEDHMKPYLEVGRKDHLIREILLIKGWVEEMEHRGELRNVVSGTKAVAC